MGPGITVGSRAVGSVCGDVGRQGLMALGPETSTLAEVGRPCLGPRVSLGSNPGSAQSGTAVQALAE